MLDAQQRHPDRVVITAGRAVPVIGVVAVAGSTGGLTIGHVTGTR
jgi:hypothetical protein